MNTRQQKLRKTLILKRATGCVIRLQSDNIPMQYLYPETIEKGWEVFNGLRDIVKIEKGCDMIQLFANDGSLLDEHVVCTVMVKPSQYQATKQSIRLHGVAYSFSKQNERRIVRNYNGVLRVFCDGLPWYKFINAKKVFNSSKPLSDLGRTIQERMKHCSLDKAITDTMSDIHEAQGRPRKAIPFSERPLGHCGKCHRRETTTKRHQLCARCKTVLYCCRECQANDWAKHKRSCKR